MSTSGFRSLSARAGGALTRNAPSLSVSSYGRTASYRRITTLTGYSSLCSRSTGLTLHAPRPSGLSSSITAAPVLSIRHVSFKEMREERARQKAGGQKAPEPPRAQPKKQETTSEPAPEPEPEPVKASERSEADEVFERLRAESASRWSKKAPPPEDEKSEEDGAEGEKGEKSEKGDQKAKKEKDEAPPPPHGSKTPWQVFTETLQSEFKASKEWEESTKQLSGSINDFTQNPNVQRARSAYSKAAEVASSTTGKAIFGTASAIGKGASWTWQTPVVRGIRAGAAAAGSGVEKATRPLRETEAYKNVKDVIDDGASQRYGGWTEKEERRKRREQRDAKIGYKAPEQHDEDPNAGTNVTVHKDSAWKESWKNFRENSSVMKRFFDMGSTYRESENPLISTARSVSDRIAGFFAENETAQVIKRFREMDPSFQMEPFLEEMRTYILPEVLEAYVKGDVEVLKQWLSAAQFSVYHALMQQYTTAGLKSDGKILDIRGVDVLNARLLDPGEIPVFVLMCRTQEVHVYRNAKSGELAAGMEDKVQQVTYAIGVTRIPEEVSNPETRGWRFIEMQKSARDYV